MRIKRALTGEPETEFCLVTLLCHPYHQLSATTTETLLWDLANYSYWNSPYPVSSQPIAVSLYSVLFTFQFVKALKTELLKRLKSIIIIFLNMSRFWWRFKHFDLVYSVFKVSHIIVLPQVIFLETQMQSYGEAVMQWTYCLILLTLLHFKEHKLILLQLNFGFTNFHR